MAGSASNRPNPDDPQQGIFISQIVRRLPTGAIWPRAEVGL
jgi:hypothetical protein